MADFPLFRFAILLAVVMGGVHSHRHMQGNVMLHDDGHISRRNDTNQDMGVQRYGPKTCEMQACGIVDARMWDSGCRHVG